MRFQASSESDGVLPATESGDGMEQPLEVDGEKFENVGEMVDTDMSRVGEKARRALGAGRWWKLPSYNSVTMSSTGGGAVHPKDVDDDDWTGEKEVGETYDYHVAVVGYRGHDRDRYCHRR